MIRGKMQILPPRCSVTTVCSALAFALFFVALMTVRGPTTSKNSTPHDDANLEHSIKDNHAKNSLKGQILEGKSQKQTGTNHKYQQSSNAASDSLGYEAVKSLTSQDGSTNADLQQTQSEQVFIREQMDYPIKTSLELFSLIGDVVGVTTMPNGHIVLLHRGSKHWTADTFFFNRTVSEGVEEAQSNLIQEDTILILDRNRGKLLASFGANLFHMPHGIASDELGNLWVTDVGRHQVMRLPTKLMLELTTKIESNQSFESRTQQVWPDIVLGEPFYPGTDDRHFCQPSAIVVALNSSLVYVADGYCNSRVMVFTKSGRFLTSFGEEFEMNIVHSLALLEDRDLICVADREGARIVCFRAGLGDNILALGQPVLLVDYPIGNVYSIAALDSNNLLVSSLVVSTNKFELSTINLNDKRIQTTWTSNELQMPHDMAATRDKSAVFIVDADTNPQRKLYKFKIIHKMA